jgi:hypothetical protein
MDVRGFELPEQCGDNLHDNEIVELFRSVRLNLHEMENISSDTVILPERRDIFRYGHWYANVEAFAYLLDDFYSSTVLMIRCFSMCLVCITGCLDNIYNKICV